MTHEQKELKLPQVIHSLQYFELYQANTRFYLIGSDVTRKQHKVLKIECVFNGECTEKQDFWDCDLHFHEDPMIYDTQQIDTLLEMIDLGNQGNGGILKRSEGYGIIGFVKFTRGYWLVMITERRRVGSIGCHTVYTIKQAQYVPLYGDAVSLPSAHINEEPTSTSSVSHSSASASVAVSSSSVSSSSSGSSSAGSPSASSTSIAAPQPPGATGRASKRKQNSGLDDDDDDDEDSEGIVGSSPPSSVSSASPSSSSLNHKHMGKKGTGSKIKYAKAGISSRSRFAIMRGKFRRNNENKYIDIFRHFDLTKNFYFSYSYDLSNTLQHNMVISSEHYSDNKHRDMNNDDQYQEEKEKEDTVLSQRHQERQRKSKKTADTFVWNAYLVSELSETLEDKRWILPLIHGYFGETHFNIVGRQIKLILLSRRSRFYAGTRFLKRGITNNGHVGNHVETEQIVYDKQRLIEGQRKGIFSSIVQVRGSVPLFWEQSLRDKMIKPHIIMTKFDPEYKATRKHFEDLYHRYGGPIIVLDLVKQIEKSARESKLGRAFREAVEFMNEHFPSERQIKFIAWDFRRASKTEPEKVLNDMAAISEQVLHDHDIFFVDSFRRRQNLPRHQSGVVRTNCIDSLDRTNISQLFISKRALAIQLRAMEVIPEENLVHYSQIVNELRDLYDEMGDCLALQYGGSKTVSAGINHRGFSWDMITSLRRFYSNNFTDENKQNAFDLFLGIYRPHKGVSHLWDLEDDLYLHSNISSSLQNTSIKMASSTSSLPLSSSSSSSSSSHLLQDDEKEDRDDLIQEYYDAFYREVPYQHRLTRIREVDDYSGSINVQREYDVVSSTYKQLSAVENKMQRYNSILASHIAEDDDFKSIPMIMNPQRSFDPSENSVTYTEAPDSKEYQAYVEMKVNQEWQEYNQRRRYQYANYVDVDDLNRFRVNPKERLIYKNTVEDYTAYVEDSTVYKEYVSSHHEDYSHLSDDNYDEYFGPIFSRVRKYFPDYTNHSVIDRIKQLIHVMRDPERGLVVEDRVRHIRPSSSRFFSQTGLSEMIKGRVYRQCFVGCEAVDWVLDHASELSDIELGTREEASEFLELLLDAHLFVHVVCAHPFIDGFFLYKFEQDFEVRVLNMNVRRREEEARHPLVVAMALMETLAQFSFDHAFAGNLTSVSPRELQNIGTREAFKFFEIDTTELQMTDISVLDEHERLCFFTNIYNVLFVHGIINYIVVNGNHASPTKAHDLIRSQFVHYFATTTAYQISGCRFSLSDIKDGILRGNRRPAGALFKPFATGADERLKYCVTIPDIRVHFMLNDSFEELKLESLPFKSYDTLLREKAESFCSQCVSVDGSRIILPKLFQNYAEDFGGDDVDIIRNISKFLKPTIRRKIFLLLKNSAMPKVYYIG